MAPRLQITLKDSSDWIEGPCLDQIVRTRVRFHPANEDEGIVFIRSDLPDGAEVRCAPDNLRNMPRWTALESAGVWVHHTEHVLAAVAFCHVDNLRIEMDSDRLPIAAGGACADFLYALQSAGVVAQHAPRRVYSLKAPFFHLDRENTQGEESDNPPLKDGRYVLGIPAETFSVSTVFHWSHLASLPVGVAEYEEGRGGMVAAIARARSYLVETEREQVRDLLGPVQDQLMMLRPNCSPEWAHEAARHKIVDFVGDMMVLGRPLVGRFVAFRAGHRIHHDVIQRLIGRPPLTLVELG